MWDVLNNYTTEEGRDQLARGGLCPCGIHNLRADADVKHKYGKGTK